MGNGSGSEVAAVWGGMEGDVSVLVVEDSDTEIDEAPTVCYIPVLLCMIPMMVMACDPSTTPAFFYMYNTYVYIYIYIDVVYMYLKHM